MGRILFIFILLLFTWTNSYSQEEPRIVYLRGEINPLNSYAICKKLMELDSESNLPIILNIDSNGGNVYDLLGIYDTMLMITSPVYTECQGTAASSAAILLALGEKGHRGATRNSRILLHPMSGFGGEDPMHELKVLEDEIYSYLSEATLHPIETIRQDCSYEHWFTAEEALKYGLIDYIIENPEFSIPETRDMDEEAECF